MQNNKKFSIILPVLNEENNIKQLIFLITKNLKNFNYEIIFIDDNSSDNTGKNIKTHVSRIIKYFLRKKNKDLTKSCFLGIQKSKYENIIIMDSDLQHDPKYLPQLVNFFFKKNYDFVVGVRNFKEIRRMNIFRKMASILLSYMFNTILGYRVSDPMSGLFIFKKKIYYTYKSDLFGRGWKILADLIYNKENFSIKEVKIEFNHRLKNKSKMNLKVLINIMRLFLHKFRLLKI
jgi:dolichol-phosphate mannosyltransferase